MSSPPSVASRTATAELKKLEMEIELLKRERKWFWIKLPVLSTVVAAAGIFFGVWQFQRTELAQIEERTARIQNETAERINKIQDQIQVNEGLLSGFENDLKMSPAQAGLLIDGLGRLVRQLPERESEEERITDHLRDIVWSLRFEQKRDFDFELQALSRSARYRMHWQAYPQSHTLFLTRMYYPRIEKYAACFQQVVPKGQDFDYSKIAKDCDKELIGAIIHGLVGHLRINSEQLDERIRTFVTYTHNAALGDQLKSQVAIQ